MCEESEKGAYGRVKTQPSEAPPTTGRYGQPHFLALSGWQGTDEEHPPGEAHPAYRAVYKTLRLGLPAAEFGWPNLRVRFGHGDVHRGGVTLPGATPARQRDRWILPEAGPLVPDGEMVQYEPRVNMHYQFAGWEGTVEEVFFVEFVLLTAAEEPRDRLAEGRRTLASLKTMLELRFGPRVLGLELTEELGELFDDGHFNRSLQSQELGAESQLDAIPITKEELLGWAHGDLNRHVERPVTDKERVRLACDWYWSAIHADQLVTEYIELWFVVEALLMPNASNIRPVRERLAEWIGGDEKDWREVVGRHFGRRSKLVHGQEPRVIAQIDVENLRALVEALLQTEFGTVDEERASRLRASAGIES